MSSKIVIKTQEDLLEFLRENITKDKYLSIRGVARLCGIADKSLINGGSFNSEKLGQTLIENGFEIGSLIKTGFNAKATWLVIEYYAYDSRTPKDKAKQLARTFGQLGLELTFNKLAETKKRSLYPDRSEEYKELSKQIKELLKETKAGKHHYIILAQTLNAIVGKVEGRTENAINETENLAYCLLMKKALNTGMLFLESTNNNFITREAINKQLVKLAPDIQAIQQALINLS